MQTGITKQANLPGIRVPVVFLGVLLAMFGTAVSRAESAPRNPDTYFFEQTFGDMPEEMAAAKKKGKQGILLFFEQEECPFCHRMKTTVLNQPDVQDYFHKHFSLYSVDIESDNEMVDFDGKPTNMKKLFARVANNRGATPVIAIFDLQGNLVVRYTGATSGVDEFMWLGQYASEGHYKNMSFTSYKRQKRAEQKS